MRAYELYEKKQMAKVGDSIDFPDDSITDKGPCSGSIKKIDGNTVWFSVSDTVFETNWPSLLKKSNVSGKPGYWSFVNKNNAQETLTDYDIDGELWEEKGMPIKNNENRQITLEELKKLEHMLDRLYSELHIDVDFTKHFLDRVNDPRNGKQITVGELQKIFTEVFRKYKDVLRTQAPGFEAVMSDISTNLNIPFVFDWDSDNNERDMVAKTAMRKPDFSTSDKKLVVGQTSKKVA